MKKGDRVRILASHIPATRWPVPAGTIGTVVEVPEEYEGRFVVVRSSGLRNDEWLPEGTGWTFNVADLEPITEKLGGQIIRLVDGRIVVPVKLHGGADGWACVVVAGPNRYPVGTRVCVREEELRAGEWMDLSA